MPVIRYRAMINRIAAPGLECRRYWYRYGDDALDLCDALSCFSSGAKVKLHELCRALGLPGKPSDIDGSLVEAYFKEGRISEIANYCETDVLATYRVWLIYELFRGTLKQNEFAASEEDLLRYLRTHLETKPHLKHPDWQLSSKGSGTAEPLQRDDLAVFFDPALTCPCDPSGE